MKTKQNLYMITSKNLSPTDKDRFVDLCFERFGSMNKNDYEVALFALLLRNGWKDKSDFDISQLMKITETKVKRLRYESNLKYSDNSDLKGQLKTLLSSINYKFAESNRIQFLIKDKNLRLYANNILEQQGSFSDSSFNSDVVSVTPEDMMVLLGYVADQDTKKVKELLQNAKSELKKSKRELPQDTKEKVKKFAFGLLSILRKSAFPSALNVVFDYIKDYVDITYLK